MGRERKPIAGFGVMFVHILSYRFFPLASSPFGGDVLETAAAGSLGLATRHTDLNPPGRNLRVFLSPHEVNFCRPYICMSCKFAHLVQSTVTMHLK